MSVARYKVVTCRALANQVPPSRLQSYGTMERKKKNYQEQRIEAELNFEFFEFTIIFSE